MTATAIRQAPGWWASLVRAECDTCGWRGPVRNLNEGLRMETLVTIDWNRHQCGEASDGN